MTTHNYTLPLAIAVLMLSTAPVLTSCASAKPLPPKAEQALSQLKEAAQNLNPEAHACGEYIAKVRELSKGVGAECLGLVRAALAERGGG